jgi:type VI secretion system protein ImpI
MIGRDPGAAHCVIEDQRISKLHACLDVQDRSISVRDLGSMNGTYVGGRRLTPNCWVRPGAAGEPVELTIGDYKIIASVFQDDAADVRGPASLAEFANQFPSRRSGEAPGRTAAAAGPRPPSAPPQSSPPIGTFEMRGSVLRLAPRWASASSGVTAFCDALAQELDAAPLASRQHVCQELVNAFANLTDDPRARTVLERYGWRASSSHAPPASTSLGGAALVAMQELAGWYVGRDRMLTTPAEVASFKDKLRATLDEFLVGFPALLESMTRFEKQMAIQSDPGTALPSSPAQLAAMLLDWLGNSDSVRQRLRASFAELMMHEVALLNGVMTGVKAILTQLSPAQIEKAAEGNRHGLFGRTDPWTAYKRRHSDLADEENERFRLLFGPEFVEEYRQFTQDATLPEKEKP